MDNNNSDIRKELIEKCLNAKEKAYCPYSKFRVGAAVVTEDNKIFTGFFSIKSIFNN